MSKLDVSVVWQAYLEFHPRSILTRDRRDLIQRRLAEGFDTDTLIDAIRGNHADPHCNGENDLMRQYHSLGLILRNADHIERYAELAHLEHKPRHDYVEETGDEVPPPADLLKRLRGRK